MKVKVVLSLILSMLLLASCGVNDKESENDSTKKEETQSTSSTIGGGQSTPTEGSVFRN